MQPEDNLKLQTFVDAGKTQGATDDFLAALLTRRGWQASDVYAALGNFWERSTGLAIPERAGAAESARDAFLYLLSFSTLATWTMSVGSMIFEFINHWFPDAVSRNNAWDLRAAVTWQMASVAVAFPIYLLVMRTILRETAQEPERLNSGVRKWLTYIALLGTAGAMICDLIWFLDYFLTGELTMRFVLKASTVMLISAAVFSYYLTSLKRANPRRSAIYGAAATLLVTAAFSIGLGLAGTPSKQRLIEADRKRVEDLRNMAFAIKLWHDRNPNATLPVSLADLKTGLRMTDPETGAAYEYHQKPGSGYELCAAFSSESTPGRPGFWDHGKGRSCFLLDASTTPAY